MSNADTAPAPKKKHTVRNVILILCALAIAGFVGCTALVGSAFNEADKAVKKHDENKKPHDITEGKAFSHDVWEGSSGWKVTVGGPLDTADVEGLKLTNTGDKADTPFLTFNLDDGDNVLASIDCHGAEAEPGQTVRMQCVDDDAPDGEWESVSVQTTL